MHDKIKNNVLVKLSDDFTEEQLRIIGKAIEVTMYDYDVTAKSTEIMCCDYGVTEIKAFAVARSVEGLSKQTLEVYILLLMNFYKYVGKNTNDLQTNDIRRYLHTYKTERGISNRTLESHRVIINTYLKWCVSEGYCDTNPCEQVKPIKFSKRKLPPLTPYELEKVRSACETTREHAIIELLYSTGCRVTELSRLNKSDVNFETGEVYLFGKGDKYRTSYLNAKAEYWLRKYLSERTDDNESLFVSIRRPFVRVERSGLERVVAIIGKRCELGKSISPHTFRRSNATHSVQRGCRIEEVAHLLGHVNVATTLLYTTIMDDEVKRKHGLCIV